MGLFAEWQPAYGAHGIATFPVRDKRPAVKGYLKIGDRVSGQLALKFANDNAFGFACKSSRITVLDIDAPDERLLADALDQHGPTPLIIRSGSGNFQAWYRHAGERRKVRPDPAKPIDILGDGFVVAPPSQGSKGQYQIIAGTLDDLDRLPTMKGLNSDPNKKQNTLSPFIQGGLDDLETLKPLRYPSQHTNKKQNTPSPLPSPPPVGASEKSDGARNDTLWRECMKLARGSRNIEELMVRAMEHNQSFYEPLPADEVLKIVASAWGYECEGKNWFGHGARIVFDADEFDDLGQDPFFLLATLRRHNWGRDFVLANSMAASLGWGLPRFQAARKLLIGRGKIECIHPGGRGPNDPPVYRFTTA